jgi:hypothetical protein
LTKHWFIFSIALKEEVFSSPPCGVLVGIYIIYGNS